MTTSAHSPDQSGPPPKRKRNIGLLLLISFVAVVLVLETALVVMAFVSPTAAEDLTAQVAGIRKVVLGDKGKPGLPARAMDGLNNFYQDQVVTLWSAPKPEGVATTFAKCGSCHPDYETTSRFEHVYMNHSVHAQTGLTCAKCHTMVQHPNPDRPAESTCAKCHDEVNQKGKCDFCHPPGTLPHFYLMGAPRNEFIDCATCHPDSTIPQLGKTLVQVGDFSGNPDSICLECHSVVAPVASPSPFASPTPFTVPARIPAPWPTEIPAWCQHCHGTTQPIPHEADWIVRHREVAMIDPTDCTNCHSQEWCAMKCHAVTSFGAPPLLPLPSPSPIAPVAPSPSPSPSPKSKASP